MPYGIFDCGLGASPAEIESVPELCPMEDDNVDVQASLVQYSLVAPQHNYYQVHGQCEMEKGNNWK